MTRHLHKIALVFSLVSCAASDRSLVYTEEGLRAAEQTWHAFYMEKADDCESKFEPKTPAMEECFGNVYDADAAVADAVRTAVGLLRSYWIARAQGENPDWPATIRRVVQLFETLPPEAREYFDRVKGLPK